VVRVPALLAVALCFTLACGPGPASTDSDSTGTSDATASSGEAPTTGVVVSCDGLEPVPEAEFPDAFAVTVCAQRAACGCPVDEFHPKCEDYQKYYSEMRAYASAHELIYDGDCVARKLAVLAASGCTMQEYLPNAACEFCPIYRGQAPTASPCADLYGELITGCIDEFDRCFGDCAPLLNTGETCNTPPYACLPGLVCDGNGYVCASAGLGEPCVLDSGQMYLGCADGLWCDHDTNLCTERRPLGAPCATDKACQTDACVGHVCADAERVCRYFAPFPP
jgi:hypothetical protein